MITTNGPLILGYGYTTTNSFVKVEYGGNAHISDAAAYPFSRTINSPSSETIYHPGSISTSVPLHFPSTTPPPLPLHFPSDTPAPPLPLRFPSTTPSPDPDHQHQWSKISQYHLKQHEVDQKQSISQPSSLSLMPLDSHIKQTTIGPAVLPPLTPIINRLPLKSTLHTPNHVLDKVFTKPPSIRFDQDFSPNNILPVTLPPFSGSNFIEDDTFYVR